MKLRGGITIFLSLAMVCILSLLLGLLESARTTGARLYGQMAADSAAASVMSQYNRNLWDMYHLLFLEAESEQAIEQSFSEYLSYYLEQENWYSMKLEDTDVTGITGMMDDGGIWLEKGAIDSIMYRLPEVANDLTGIAEDAANASKVGDFRTLFEVCRQTGRKTGKLENCRRKIENSLERMRVDLEEFDEDALKKEMKGFSRLVKQYEEEVQRISDHRTKLSREIETETKEVSESLSQELLAYEQVEGSAREQLDRYREMEIVIRQNLNLLEEASELPEEERYEVILELTIPGESLDAFGDTEKLSLLEQLEELFQGDLLALVLPTGTEVSKKTVSLTGIPSNTHTERGISDEGVKKESITDRLLVNEYCILNFRSFQKSDGFQISDSPLRYEQEYLLSGKTSDRENLALAIEKLLTIRGAMNLLYLLRSPEKLAEAEVFSLAVSGGFAPLTYIMKFFVLTLWAFGEAVLDVRTIMSGGRIPFWKEDRHWKLGIQGLLEFQFLDSVSDTGNEGQDYGDHMRILLFLLDREMRNYRMMDLIQWNLRTVQADFAVSDCSYQVDLTATVLERHRFLIRDTYTRTIRTVGYYESGR